MEAQIVGGWVIFIAGILTVVLSLVAVGIKVLFTALASLQGAQLTGVEPPGGVQIIAALIRSPYGLAFVLGALAIHLGLIMLGGGHFLGLSFLSFSDPTP